MNTRPNDEPTFLANQYVPAIVNQYNRLLDGGFIDDDTDHRDYVVVLVIPGSRLHDDLKKDHQSEDILDDGTLVWVSSRNDMIKLAKKQGFKDTELSFEECDKDAGKNLHQEWISYLLILKDNRLHISYVALEHDEEACEFTGHRQEN